MQEYTPVQWLQKVTRNCVDFLAQRESETMEDSLKMAYEEFSDTQRRLIHKLLLEQFENGESIYILSYLVNILGIEEFWQDTADRIEEGEFDGLTGCMLEMQLEVYGKIPYRQMRNIHKRNVARLAEEVEFCVPYVPLEKRNRKRIVVVTENLVSRYHAPTMMTLQTVYVLQEKLGYEVLLLTCTSNGRDLISWRGPWWCSVMGERGNGIIDYKDGEINLWQYPMDECGIEGYREMLARIYSWNPWFVLNMGVSSAIVDLPTAFTTVVARVMTVRTPVSEAQIWVRAVGVSKEQDAGDESELDRYQKQVFMDQKFPPIVTESTEVQTRSKLGLPEDGFLIAIVGNRLQTEMDEAFVGLMQQILKINEKVNFVFIGATELELRGIEDREMRRRVHYLGFCEDLLGVYRVLDLYLNPKRAGGGWSSAIALRAGLPVVTLPECDVAYNVGRKFEVRDYEQMFAEVIRYMTDTVFYKAQSECAKKLAMGDEDEKSLVYVRELIAKVQEAMAE